MKQILASIIFVIVFNNIKAQTNYTPTGTWKWISAKDTIEVFLKTDQLYIGNQAVPIVIGFHKYVKNAKLIENSLLKKNTNYINEQYSIVLFNQYSDFYKLSGSIKDITLNYTRTIILTKINPTTMSVRLTSMEGRRKNGTISAYTLPRNFTLTKQ